MLAIRVGKSKSGPVDHFWLNDDSSIKDLVAGNCECVRDCVCRQIRSNLHAIQSNDPGTTLWMVVSIDNKGSKVYLRCCDFDSKGTVTTDDGEQW